MVAGRPRAVLALCSVAFALVHLPGGGAVTPPWATSYLDDLLCLPLVLGATLVAHRLRSGDRTLVLPLGHGLFAVALFSLVFEGILPRLAARHTADPWDLVMYAAGFAVFQLGINRRQTMPSSIWRTRRTSSSAPKGFFSRGVESGSKAGEPTTSSR